MAWNSASLADEVREIFHDAQDYVRRRARAFQWAAHSSFVARHAAAKRRYTLRQIRKRLHDRAVIACANPKCRVQFVPYRADTSYCTAACRIRHLSLQAYHRRRARQADQRTRVCPMCAEHFSDRKADAVYCSTRCNRMAVRRRQVA